MNSFGTGHMSGALRIILVGATAVALACACGSASSVPSGGGPSGGPPSSSPVTASTSGAPAAATPATGGATGPSTPALPAGYLPLFPFTAAEAVTQWQDSYRSGGHQPWHLDAGATAVAFARWLGYTEVDRVTSTSVHGADALIGVGWLDAQESPKPATVAVVHLKRFGTGREAPWEVVGTNDTDLTLTTPQYGSTITSPVTVGGRITGVDEALQIKVLGPTGTVLGTAGPLTAGGENRPWTATVKAGGRPGEVLVIAVSTGGHLRTVERFAVTGVRLRG